MKPSTVIAAVAAFAGSSDAFWRMVCKGRAGLARIDPLVSPGEVAQHVHSIHGSSGFSESATYDDVVNADCTSCAVTQDKSVYWHPSLYFKHDNGSFELVPQTGGMLAYYFLNPTPGQTGNITAFPQGFRMIAGDSLRRNYSIAGTSYTVADPEKSLWAQLGQTSQVDLAQRAIGFNCLNYAKAAEGSLYRHYLPTKDYLDANCANGVRFEMMFPSCWDGKNLDSPNHKSHVAYPDLVINGNCPSGYDVRLPGLFFETIWETDAFSGVNGEFVISNGDIQGFGYHADFIMGWPQDLLQQAVDTCTNESGEIADCPLFNIQSEQDQTSCQLKKLPAQLVKEAVTGIVGDTLPGGVAIQYGPQPATQVNPAPQTTTVDVPTVSYSPGTTATNSGSVLPGQVFKESSSSEAPTPSTTPEAASTPDAAASPAKPTFPTAAPASAPQDDGLPIVSTQYITNGNVVSEVVWKEAVVYITESEDVTVTVTVQQPTSSVQAVRKLRRGHGHDHFHRHLRHGRR
ncbi:hypothetical protein CONLIGDRAFT_575792 [Coniochaeta ligniaria NRRL 30616]|uniref:DUF1996 domain-containing protein n=1 Tax=Coniochaeta ligniaria NRRL 30616 TaxID=1408157 RepID=A0A1J7JQH2_9PEZI|nr:hypothetical protein CONLIGDRAFT_575792 [Coniochaeta ligniaria NRRL 30616]